MCHYETPPYFLVDFLSFSRYLKWLLRPQSMLVLEKIVQFSCSHFHRVNILSSRILVLLYCSIPYILHSSQCHYFYQNYQR